MILTEFDQEKYEAWIRNESWVEGRNTGRQEGKNEIIRNLLESFSPEQIAALLKMSIDDVNKAASAVTVAAQ